MLLKLRFISTCVMQFCPFRSHGWYLRHQWLTIVLSFRTLKVGKNIQILDFSHISVCSLLGLLKTSELPFLEARWSADLLSAWNAFTFAPLLINKSTIWSLSKWKEFFKNHFLDLNTWKIGYLLCPTAFCSGVCPALSVASTSAPLLINNSPTLT